MSDVADVNPYLKPELQCPPEKWFNLSCIWEFLLGRNSKAVWVSKIFPISVVLLSVACLIFCYHNFVASDCLMIGDDSIDSIKQHTALKKISLSRCHRLTATKIWWVIRNLPKNILFRSLDFLVKLHKKAVKTI